MNSVSLTGRWTKDIEFKATESGGVAKCSLAVEEGYGGKKYTSFLDVIMFGKTAEAVANFSGKGRKVGVVGRLKQERWEKDGHQQSAVRIYANDVEFLDYKDDDGRTVGKRTSDDDAPPPIDESDLPF
jgi:single-strand DNA-binding protein